MLPGLTLLCDYDNARLAANLLYLMVKDHPLSDGNRRSAAALFVTFLAHNEALCDVAGRARVSNKVLSAITLLVAMSEPKEKELMVELIIRILMEEGPMSRIEDLITEHCLEGVEFHTM